MAEMLQWIQYRLQEQTLDDTYDERYSKRKDLPWNRFLNLFLPFTGDEQGAPGADFSSVKPRASCKSSGLLYKQAVQTKLVSHRHLYIARDLS